MGVVVYVEWARGIGGQCFAAAARIEGWTGRSAALSTT